MDKLGFEQVDICQMVRKGQEDDYDFVNSLSCPLTATAIDSLLIIAVFIGKMKCADCNHYERCKLRKIFNC
jgi:hypothetical protein